MSASKAPENEVISAALMAHMVPGGCPMDLEHWHETESELMRLYDEYTAVELLEMMQVEAWARNFSSS
jgi:hypothetical protein